MTTKQYLSQARYLDERINTKIDQVKSLHDLATKATSTLSDMPGSPTRNTHSMENIIVKILMLENAINTDIECLVNLRNEINNTINAVDDDDCRLLLEKRYIGMEKWEDIALEMNISLPAIYRLHRDALKKIEFQKVDSK